MRLALPEHTTLTRRKNNKAFDKIKAGLDQARAYLDASADKHEFRVHEPTDTKINPTATRAQPPEDAK
jgi:hypothetical protein